MKFYNDLPLSYWLDDLLFDTYSHNWGGVDICIRAVCYIIDRQDLFDSYRECDVGTSDFIDSVWDVYYAGCYFLWGSGA